MTALATLVTEPWADFGLVDSGHGRKLERYGRFRFIRPEPQAMWAPASADWKADGEFIGGSDEDGGGRWQLSTNVPERWAMKRPSPGGEVSFWANNTPFRHLGFFPDMGGQFDWLASRIKPGDRVLVGTKPTGTLLVEDLKPGRNLFLLATGTGLAPFMSIVQDPATYERFDQVVLAHGVRFVSELAYRDHILHDLPRHEFLRELVRDKLRYYPTVTREDFKHVGRLTTLLDSGRLLEDLGLPALDPALDRAMVCGSMGLNTDIKAIMEGFGLQEGANSDPKHYVVEKAFVG